MRKFFFFFALFLTGCAGSGDDGSGATSSSAVAHKPEITGFTLSPDTATQMEGGGTVLVTARVTAKDAGLDIQTLWVRMPDGSSVEFNESLDVETGTITENIVVATNEIGTFVIETWLVDKAGDSSVHHSAHFSVLKDVGSGDWTSRLSGLPYVLHDVVWNGAKFIAVGDSGVILTSVDGIDWAEQASGTDADLSAVAAEGTDVAAVGFDATVLLSRDQGQTWSIKHGVDRIHLAAVTMSASQIVAGGMNLNTGDPFMIRSLDRGDTWTVVDPLPQTGHFISDLLYANGMYIAATDAFSSKSDARVWVSVAGEVWHDIILSNTGAGIYTILHDGTKFFAGGSDNRVFTSLDGYNWIEMLTPVDRVDYLSAASSGTELVMAGGITWWYWWGGTTPDFHRDVGLSSTDGGMTWDTFDIGGYYQSNGMAWGNGRFVSVGRATPVSIEGAVYTSD